MNRTGSSPQGMLFIGDTIIHVENAVIEEVAVDTEKTGYLLISFEVSDENNMIYLQEVRLNVGNNTIIIDEDGTSLNMYDLQEGMQIAADFSSVMTRSIPPRADAYRIVVLQEEYTSPISCLPGAGSMSKRINKPTVFAYEGDFMNNKDLITIKGGDVSGDGIPDKVYLYGSKSEDSESSFVDNISIVIEDGYSGITSTITPEFNAGYHPVLFLGDFTADKVEDIKLSIDSGGSGGYGYFYIYSYTHTTPKEIFNFDQYNALYQYKVDYIDLYRVAVYNINHDKLFVLDLSLKGEDYVAQYYDEFGRLIVPIQGDVLALSSILPFIQNEEVNAYELLAYQRIIGPINSDTLGYIENVLSWDGKEFVSTRMSVVIPGLLLNPPV